VTKALAFVALNAWAFSNQMISLAIFAYQTFSLSVHIVVALDASSVGMWFYTHSIIAITKAPFEASFCCMDVAALQSFSATFTKFAQS
jgi:hypothetical protein